MIILAAAVILSLNSSGIIVKANKAKSDTDKATKEEAAAKTVNTNGAENTCKNSAETTPQQATGITRDESITWKYFGIDENGEALIVGSATSSTSKLTLGGNGGYYNYVSNTRTFILTQEIKKIGGIMLENGMSSLEFVTRTPDGADIKTYDSNQCLIYKTNNAVGDKEKRENLIYPGENSDLTVEYFLATSYSVVDLVGQWGEFRIGKVFNARVQGDVMAYTTDVSGNSSTAIRPVVSLSSSVQMTYNGITVALS